MMQPTLRGVPQLSENQIFADGWQIVDEIHLDRPLVATSAYRAQHMNGKRGFLKVAWHGSATPTSAGPKKLEARHVAEVELLTYCTSHNVPGVIKLLGSGTIVDSKKEAFEYLITDLADENADFVFETITPDLLWWLAAHIMQIAHSLAHLHHHGIFHRDITTRNILLADNRSRSLLTDFGHAYHLGRPSPVNELPEATPLNESPPERYYLRPWTSRREKLAASELYQFGAIIFKMLVGPTLTHVLFEGSVQDLSALSRNIEGQDKKVRAIVEKGFKDATRQLTEAFQKKLPRTHHEFIGPFLTLFKAACAPDLSLRGHPKLLHANPDLRYEIAPFVDDLIALVKALKAAQISK